MHIYAIYLATNTDSCLFYITSAQIFMYQRADRSIPMVDMPEREFDKWYTINIEQNKHHKSRHVYMYTKSITTIANI